jgi:hypothetical protein
VASNFVYDNSTGRFRIGAAPLVAGGQYVSVAAAWDVLPMWAAAGSVVPALDPSVATLMTPTSPPPPAGTGVLYTPAQLALGVARVSYVDRSNITHLWTFSRSLSTCAAHGAGAVLAAGQQWDGLNMTVACAGAGSNLTLTLNDPYMVNRTSIVQLALPGSGTGCTLTNVTMAVGGGPAAGVPAASSWQSLAWVLAANATSAPAAWAPPSLDSPGVWWLRVAPLQRLGAPTTAVLSMTFVGSGCATGKA